MFGDVVGLSNPLGHTAKFGNRDSLETKLSFSSDDPAAMGSGRGHLPLAGFELADSRHRSDQSRSSGIPGGSSLTVQRLLERGHDADSHGRS